MPLQQLHGDPAAARLSEVGGQVRTKTKVSGLAADGEGWLLRTRDGEEEHFAQVVLAVPPEQAERLLPAGALDLPAGWSAQLGTSAIVNVHLVLDRRVLDEPFFAGVDSPVQWVFDRTEQARLRSGQYLAISLSAANDLLGVPVAELRQRVLPALYELLPAAAQAQVLDFFVTREPHATFRPAPGTASLRPGQATGYPGLALAGAWTATGWPATMESAVLSGEAAARLLLPAPPRDAAGPPGQAVAAPSGLAGVPEQGANSGYQTTATGNSSGPQLLGATERKAT